MYKIEEEKQPNLSVITEQGDLGLGTRQLTDEEQKQIEETQQKQKNQYYNR